MPSLRRVFIAAVAAGAAVPTACAASAAAAAATVAAAATIATASPTAALSAPSGITPDPPPLPPPPPPPMDSGLDKRATTRTVAAPLPSTAPEYVSDALFTSAALNSTNVFRREHGAPAAAWNATIAAFAAHYLTQTDANCTFAHSGGPYGENIAVGFASVHGAIDAWGNERALYDYDRPGFSEATGHFTQLVWKNSTTVGCARRLCTGRDGGGSQSTGWFLACEYWPRGNVLGQFGEEVGREIPSASASGSGGGDGNTPSGAPEPARRPSLAVLAAAVVVFVATAAAFGNDVRLALAEPP